MGMRKQKLHYATITQANKFLTQLPEYTSYIGLSDGNPYLSLEISQHKV